MAKIEKFEDLKVWQKASEVATKVYQISKKNPLSKDYGMRDQVRRAAVSISNNIAEGFEYDNNNNEFIRFLKYAKGSAGELRNQLHILKNTNLIDQSSFVDLYHEVEELSKQLNGFIKYLQNYDSTNNRNKITEPETLYTK